jgi:hypothetical protein
MPKLVLQISLDLTAKSASQSISNLAIKTCEPSSLAKPKRSVLQFPKREPMDKKAIGLVLALSLVALLGACGGGTNAPADAPADGQAPAGGQAPTPPTQSPSP